MMLSKVLAWAIALALLALPFVGVLNGWFAANRWPVHRLDVRAEFNHVSAEQISAAAQPLLDNGFFATDLDAVRRAVAKLPWVERVEARKRWPDTINLVVYERQPYARWGGDRLVSRSGKLFSVAGTSGLQGLPRLQGPDDRLDDVLGFYADCVKEFSGSGMVIDAVTLSSRGGWTLAMGSGAVIVTGRDDAKQHLARFLDVWPNLAGSHAQPPAYIDLRYENGFAMRWAAALPPAGIRDSGLEIREKPMPPQVSVASASWGEALSANSVESRIADAQSSLFASRIPNPESRIPAFP